MGGLVRQKLQASGSAGTETEDLPHSRAQTETVGLGRSCTTGKRNGHGKHGRRPRPRQPCNASLTSEQKRPRNQTPSSVTQGSRGRG